MGRMLLALFGVRSPWTSGASYEMLAQTLTVRGKQFREADEARTCLADGQDASLHFWVSE